MLLLVKLLLWLQMQAGHGHTGYSSRTLLDSLTTMDARYETTVRKCLSESYGRRAKYPRLCDCNVRATTLVLHVSPPMCEDRTRTLPCDDDDMS